MKLQPHEHRKAAGRLRELAKHSTIEHEKQHLLDTANGFEMLAKVAEKRQQQAKEDEERRVPKAMRGFMPNPTGEGIRNLLGGEPAGKISMEEAKAGILAALIEGAEAGKSTKGNV